MQTAENRLFPVFLKLEKFRVLVIGGGKVALEKVRAILNNSPATRITLVAIDVVDEIVALQNQYSNLVIHKRPFSTSDLNDTDFVIAAVNSKALSLDIKQEAEKRKIITNVADTPEQCDFYLGSVVQKGHVKIAVSTNGKSPTIAKRIREVFEEEFPHDINHTIDNLSRFRTYLSGDFTQKVKQLNDITSKLSSSQEQKKKRRIKRQIIGFSVLFGILLFVTGYLFAFYYPETIGNLVDQIDISQWKFALIGFIAEVINGALGMAYGLTTTTMLLASGIVPAFVLIIVHILEVFTAGATGAIHYKLGNVNKKLLRKLLIPGIIGAVAGAYLVYYFKQYTNIIKPLVATYTLILGLVIVFKALRKSPAGGKVKRFFPLALIAGFLDSIGGGGWGTIVSSTLIAGGRSPRYTIGSVILSRCFVALAGSVSLFFLIGFSKWSIIGWLVAGGLVGSPIGPLITKHIPVKVSMWLVAITIILLSLKQIFF